VKVRRLVVEGFRGIPRRVELPLPPEGACILAENGHGKTTFVDALDILTSGDLKYYHREGYGLDSVVNIDAPFARVTCETTTGEKFSRLIERTGVMPVLIENGRGASRTKVPPIPILRHRTMTELMNRSPGDKRKELLELVGLSSLMDLRQAMRTAANSVARQAEDAERSTGSERAAVRTLVGSRDVHVRAEELRVAAELDTPILAESDLLALTFAGRPEGRGGTQTAVAELARARGALDVAAATDWNAAIADEQTATEMLVADLLEVAARVLPGWSDATCPLCHQETDTAALAARVGERLAAVSAARQRDTQLRRRIASHRAQVAAMIAAIEGLIASPPGGGWPDLESLQSSVEGLQAYQVALSQAVDARAVAPRFATVSLPSDEVLSAQAKGDADTSRLGSLAALAVLQEASKRLRAAEKVALVRRTVASACSVALELVDEQVKREIEDAIVRLGGQTAAFYGRLVGDAVYSNVELRFRAERAGGVEFVVTYAGRHAVSPPQRVLSESQLNGLGMALFLAHLKIDPVEWRTVVLDDVVNSFDANHRVGLARLLGEEFADWQIVALTHDRTFAEVTRRVVPRWRQLQIVAWSPTGGPVIDDGDPRKQLAKRLAAGEAASQLGGLARTALEQALSRPLERLGLEMRFDPLARFGAKEYLDALRHGLRSRGSTLAASPVLIRMDAATYMVNLGAHDRPMDAGLTSADLSQLVEDLEELDRTLRCSSCGDPPWTASLDGGRHHQCRCSQLVV
jgi:hypothetical protein